jgi:hypothetical protein
MPAERGRSQGGEEDAMLRHALKEWAVICRALAEGRQALLLRKGGIAEAGGEFEVEHTRFWLFPTYAHQHRAGIKPEALPLLEQAEAERPSPGVLRLVHFAEVTGVYHLHDVVSVLKLSGLHLWSEETACARFAYRLPGLYVLPVRVYRAARPAEVPDSPRYAGCKSWVELDEELPTDGAVPVLGDQAFREVQLTLDRLLEPTAFA